MSVDVPPSVRTLRRRARRLRRDQTIAEARLWSRLRDRQLAGLKFRRQHAIGPFITDFCCTQKQLVIEVDGGQHASTEASDDRRTRWLERHGYRVVRFWANDVLLETEAVILRIAQILQGPHPDPLPKGEGARKHPHPDPLPEGEGARKIPAPRRRGARKHPHPNPLPEGEGEK